MTPVEELPGRGVTVTAQLAGMVLTCPMYVGFASAVLGWRPGVAFALGGALALFVLHLAIGIVGYRRSMRRPWPAVEPLDDEDDW